MSELIGSHVFVGIMGLILGFVLGRTMGEIV